MADYKPERIKQFDVRFSKPVFPGETLVVEIWADGGDDFLPRQRQGTARHGGVEQWPLSACSETIRSPRREALIAQGEPREAARDLRARLASGRGGLLARLTLVKALLASDDMDGALAEAREAVSLNPGIAVAALALGEALLAAGALPAAIAELQRALAARSRDWNAPRFLTAGPGSKAGEADKALDAFSRVWRPSPERDALIGRAKAISHRATLRPRLCAPSLRSILRRLRQHACSDSWTMPRRRF